MTFNEFNKQLNKRISDPNLRFMLGTLYEYITHVAKQQEDMADVILNLANQTQRVAEFGGTLGGAIRKLERRGLPDGVDIQSVLPDPEEDKKR